MKKMILMAIVCVFVGISNAALVTNGDFTESAAYWDAGGGPGVWPAGWDVDWGVGGWLSAQADFGSASYWWQTVNESLNAWGIPVGTDVVVSADIIAIGVGTDGVALKIEAKNGFAPLGEYVETIPTVTGSWANYKMLIPYTIPASTDGLKVALVNDGGTNPAGGNYAFDNVEITVDPNNPALKPIPILSDAIDPIDDVLSWVNPDPNVGAVTADVYILESATALGSPAPRTGTKVATAITAETLDLSDAGFTLSADKFYYWAVDTDNGAEVVPGFTWYFTTQTIDAGADQYRWLTTGTDNFTLTGVPSGTPDSVEWLDISDPLDQAPGTTVTINSPTSSTTTVDVDGDGWYIFRYSATYGGVIISDEVNVGVYVSACEAAKADPDDIPATYPGGHGDIDGDCDTDMVDLALMAASWADCMTSKITCP